MEESMKKKLQRNMYKCRREFQSLKVSMNKKLRELGATLDGSDSATDIIQQQNSQRMETSGTLKKPLSMRGRRNLALTKEPSSNPGMNSQKSIGQDSQLSIESGAGSKTQSQILIKNKMLQKDHIKEV